MPADPDRSLPESLAGLAEVLTHTQPLTESLLQIAVFAVRAIPGADGAGLTLLEKHGPDTMVSSSDFVQAVDAVQYGIGEGPCLLAVATQAIQRSGSLGGESRWPRFGPRAGRLGVHSALSLPLLIPGQVVGALNVYGRARNAFDERSEAIGAEFSSSAAITAHHALVLEESRRMAAHLQRALSNRSTIDQAIGIIMSRTGKDPDEAFALLRQQSQLDHLKLSEIAARIVSQALARARASRRKLNPLPPE